MIYNNITELIGKTPLVKLNALNTTEANILLKLEIFNPANSIKDRAAFYMLNEAKKEGKINSETIIIEPTSGNTGIGLAMCASVMKLRTIIVMPENMSEERKKAIAGYGAELVLTPKELGMKGAVEKAVEISKENPNSFIPSQFSNPANTLAHIKTTSKEIFEDTKGEVDIVVAGIGTAGTIVGLAKGLKALKKDVKAIGIEPEESPLITKGTANLHKIQGIGANFIPDLYEKDVIDEVITIKGDDAILTARDLAKKEGIMCGISSGANVFAALELAKREENKGKTIVAIICDIGERYLSTELFE